MVRNEPVLDFQLSCSNVEVRTLTLKSQLFFPCQAAPLEVFPRVDQIDISDEDSAVIRECAAVDVLVVENLVTGVLGVLD